MVNGSLSLSFSFPLYFLRPTKTSDQLADAAGIHGRPDRPDRDGGEQAESGRSEATTTAAQQ